MSGLFFASFYIYNGCSQHRLSQGRVDCICTHSSGVQIIPSSIQFSGLEATLVNTMSREGILRTCLNELRSRFDYILIDCMPSLGMLTINALAAADSVVIPVQAHFLSVKGLGLLLQTISKVRRQLNPGLRVEGILLTMLDLRAIFTGDMAAMLRESYDGKIKVFASEYDPAGKIALACDYDERNSDKLEQKRWISET